jgi:hypothetical protein
MIENLRTRLLVATSNEQRARGQRINDTCRTNPNTNDIRMSSSGQSYSSSASSDVTPLLGNSNTNSDSGGNFYFLQQSHAGSASHGSNRSAATNEIVEKLPYGATEDEFASRPIVVSDDFDFDFDFDGLHRTM